MATYNSSSVTILSPAQNVYTKLSDFNKLLELIESIPADKVPDDKKEMFSQIQVSDSEITIPTGNPAMGNLTLRKSGCIDPTLIRLEGVGTPVPVSLALAITPDGADSCSAQVVLDIEIPAILKPMISGPVNKLLGLIADILPKLSYE